MALGISSFTPTLSDRGDSSWRNPGNRPRTPTDNTVKDPEEWTTGDDPISGG